MLYLGWIIVAFLGGGIAVYVYMKKPQTLHERFDALGSTRGKTYEAIAVAIGVAPQLVQHQQQGQTLRSWVDGNYSISLLFDCCDCCLGVMDETF